MLAAAIVCAQGAATGQDLHLKSRSVYTGPLPAGSQNRSRREPQLARRAGPLHEIIQFDHLPDVEDLETLLAAGFKVVAAVPDNAVMVVAPARNTITEARAGIRWIGELGAADKLSPELSRLVQETRKVIAEPSQQQSRIEAIVEFHADVEADVQQSIISAEGLTFSRNTSLLANHIIVTGSIDEFRALATRDEVAYIFPADPALLSANTQGNELMPCGGC